MPSSTEPEKQGHGPSVCMAEARPGILSWFSPEEAVAEGLRQKRACLDNKANGGKRKGNPGKEQAREMPPDHDHEKGIFDKGMAEAHKGEGVKDVLFGYVAGPRFVDDEPASIGDSQC